MVGQSGGIPNATRVVWQCVDSGARTLCTTSVTKHLNLPFFVTSSAELLDSSTHRRPANVKPVPVKQRRPSVEFVFIVAGYVQDVSTQ